MEVINSSTELNGVIQQTAAASGIDLKVGRVHTSEAFYTESKDYSNFTGAGCMAVEMEAAGLYMNAARAGKNALAICTISDHLLTGEATSAEERQNSFTDMMKLALETAIEL